MRQHTVHIFHDDINVQVQHSVDGIRVGIDQVAANIETGVGVQDIKLYCFLQHPWQQRRAGLHIEQIDDQRDHRITVLFANCR